MEEKNSGTPADLHVLIKALNKSIFVSLKHYFIYDFK